MAKVQTRRSVSLNRETYERLKAYCEANGMSMSQFVEARIGDFLGRRMQRAEAPQGSQKERPKPERDRAPGNIFTF